MKFFKFMPYMIEIALPNKLTLDLAQILGTDDAHVRAEVEIVAHRGTVHPTSSQPVRFPPTAQPEDEGSEGRNDTEDDVAQDNSGNTHQDKPLTRDCSEKYIRQ